jgi:hypothetical protein
MHFQARVLRHAQELKAQKQRILRWHNPGSRDRRDADAEIGRHQWRLALRLVPLALLSNSACADIDNWYENEVLPTMRGERASSGSDTIQPDSSAGVSSSKGKSEQLYTVVWRGSDGVNIRSAPGLTDVLATAYRQDSAPLNVISKEPLLVSGIPWVEVEISGWMAYRTVGRASPYFELTDRGYSRVVWDGAGNPNDNFLALRISPGKSSTLIAIVFEGATVLLGNTTDHGRLEWVSALVRGWMAVRSRSGQALIAPYLPK